MGRVSALHVASHGGPERAGATSAAAQAHRELGYIEMLGGRYDRARRWLRRAASLAGEDRAEAAWAHAVEGVALWPGAVWAWSRTGGAMARPPVALRW